MSEKEILDGIYQDLRLDQWWEELLGQPNPRFESFDLEKAIDTLPRTEVTAAEAVHQKFNNILSYNASRNQWYIWDGIIHVPCASDGIALKVAKLYRSAMTDALRFVKEYINKEAAKIASSNAANAKDDAKKMREKYDKGEISKHKRFRDRMSTDAGLSAVIRVMQTECDVDPEYFENDHEWFVMRNMVISTVDMANGIWNPLTHSPDRPVTKFFDAEYLPESERKNLTHWDKFLEYSIPDEEARLYLQKVVGAAYMAETKLRTIMNLYGPPGSGKSVFINTFWKLSSGGAGYASMPDSKSIIKVSGQNFEQDSFRGCRFIGVSEPPMHDHIDNEFLKKFTGDEWVETRTLNVKSSGWRPQGVPFIASNKAMKINTRDKAIVERVQMVEFPIEFEKDHPDPKRRRVQGLEDLIMMDRERVLEWVIQGMLRYVHIDGRQLTPPESVIALQQSVVTEASTALRWFDDCVEEGLLTVDFNMPEEYFLPVKDAYARYQGWIIQSGERHPLPLRYFIQDIEQRFGESVRTPDKIERFKGIRMTEEFRRVVDAANAPSIIPMRGF